jgi:hypothetical protein
VDVAEIEPRPTLDAAVTYKLVTNTPTQGLDADSVQSCMNLNRHSQTQQQKYRLALGGFHNCNPHVPLRKDK